MSSMPSTAASGDVLDPLNSWDSPRGLNSFDQFMDSLLPPLDDCAWRANAAEVQLPASTLDKVTVSERTGKWDCGPEVGASVPAQEGLEGEKEDRKRIKNNQAQKRFRERKREQAQQLEAQHAASTAELQELRQRQKALEARNMLLEKLMQMTTLSEPSTSAPDTADTDSMRQMWDRFPRIPEPFANVAARAPITLTVDPDNKQTLSLAEITKLSPPAFVKLHKDYSQALGMCLIEGRPTEGSSAMTRLNTLVLEWAQLMVSLVVSVPDRMKELGNGSMFEEPQEPAKFYSGLLPTLEFTDSQIADILHLRRLLYCKQGQLARRRKALLDAMAGVNVVPIEHVGEKFSQLTQCSTQLRQNGAEEYQIWVEFGCAYHAGVMTAVQSARLMVYAYPHWPKHGAIMEHLATEMGQPSSQELLEDTSVDDLQHAANWEEVLIYASSITMETIHDHVPLLPT